MAIKSGSLSQWVSDKVTYWAVRWQLKRRKRKKPPFSFAQQAACRRFHLLSPHSNLASSLHLAVMPHPDLGSEGLILYVKAYIFTWPHAFLCDAVAGGGSWTEGKKAELETNLRSRRSHFLPGLGGTWAGIAWGPVQGGRWQAYNLTYSQVISIELTQLSL